MAARDKSNAGIDPSQAKRIDKSLATSHIALIVASFAQH